MSTSETKVTDEKSARILAIEAIENSKGDHEFVILDKLTQEKEFGWVYFYDTAKAIETGDPKYRVPGSAPLIVEKETGKTHFVSSSVPPSIAIGQFEDEWKSQNASTH